LTWIIKRAPGESADTSRREVGGSIRFIVVADNDNETPLTARFATSAALDVPRVGVAHLDDPTQFCTGTTAQKRERALRIFDVTATYTNRVGIDNQDTDPLNRAPIRRLTFQDVTEPYAFDVLNTPVVNSAGTMFDPLPVRDVSRAILEIQKNVASANIAELAYYNNSVNSDNFWGWLPGEVRLKIVGGDEQEENLVRFVNVTYQLMFKETRNIVSVHDGRTLATVEGWDDVILNQGLYEVRYFVGAAEVPYASGMTPKLFPVYTPEYDTTGVETKTGSHPAIDYGTSAPTSKVKSSEPVLLDDAGKILIKLGTSLTDSENSAIEPSYLWYRPYKRLAFAPLGLI
jgi:hypothetical protein